MFAHRAAPAAAACIACVMVAIRSCPVVRVLLLLLVRHCELRGALLACATRTAAATGTPFLLAVAITVCVRRGTVAAVGQHSELFQTEHLLALFLATCSCLLPLLLLLLLL